MSRARSVGLPAISQTTCAKLPRPACGTQNRNHENEQLDGSCGARVRLWVRFHAITDIALQTYFVWFTIPAVLYIAARLLVPGFPEASLPDLGQRFRDVRVPFFFCLTVPMILEIPGLFSGTAPSAHWLLVAFGTLAASGALIGNERWHHVLLGLMAAVYVSFLVFARSSLGA